MTHPIFKRISVEMPGLREKLHSAGIQQTPEEFIKKTFLTAFYLSVGVTIALVTIMSEFGDLGLWVIGIPIGLFIVLFFYFLRAPDVIIRKREREVNREIVFAVRFLIIELQSGASLYDAMKGIEKNFDILGGYFKEIVDKIDLGTSLEDAISDVVEASPSNNFRRVLWQVLNSLHTGADVAESLSSTVDQISDEQIIEVKEYGRKLNPLAMFYMMLAVIIPSIGMVMLVMMGAFLSLQFDLSVLLSITGLLTFVQFMFFSVIKSGRPAVEI